MESVETSRTAAFLAHSFAIDEAEGVSFSVTELLASGGLVGAEWTRYTATHTHNTHNTPPQSSYRKVLKSAVDYLLQFRGDARR